MAKENQTSQLDLNAIRPTMTLNLEGEPCPYPVVYSLDAMEQLKSGEVLEVIADCPQAFNAVPEEAMRMGYKLIGEPITDGPTIRFYILKP
ncbi:SirA-like protein [Paenibacillus sp. J31TS4]|uniref:sulfurtransferase-like selenium metabolism protein YedF n=1 Tax=Paenibacillus sp. J31TS4 TaxID=2807195 RepID=UPI001B10B5E8|nr:sulfurtransferase-like selenium metabolism protein YedF [Paenibacillus sp. J31TS4]GIP41421.1 SirA-like protein [Paenibacillus sp. J31TS4]